MVKQLIYTSWKNGTSTIKGYMIYSMSVGITEADKNAILKNLTYKPLSRALPYIPTFEQVEELFPRNCTYFVLPSGKYCLAQASYIGQDYSGRVGNYIIHAYISDDPIDNAIEYVHSDSAFKRRLTEAELAADSNPPPLPEIPLPNADTMVTQAEINSFLSGDRLNQYPVFIQCVLEAIKSKRCVYIYDDYKNIIEWFRLLSVSLPRNMFAKLTFATYISGRILPDESCLLQCVVPDCGASPFRYRDQLKSGKLVFNPKDNIISTAVTPGHFAVSVCKMLQGDLSSVVCLCQSLSVYLPEANWDINMAVSIAAFYEGNIANFTDICILKQTVEAVKNSGKMSAEDIGLRLINCLSFNKYRQDERMNILSLIFSYGSTAQKKKVVHDYYLDVVDLLQQRDNIKMSECYSSLKSEAPFVWQSFADYVVFDVTVANYLNSYYNNGSLLGLLLELIKDSDVKISIKASDERQIVSECLVYAFTRNDAEYLSYVLSCVNCDAELKSLWMKGKTINDFYAVKNLSFLFAVIRATSLRYFALAEGFLADVVVDFGNENRTKEEYLKLDSAFMDKFETDNSSEARINKFIADIGLQKVMTSGEITHKELIKIFNGLYVKGLDVDGNFIKLLDIYLSKQVSSTVVKQVIEWFSLFDQKGYLTDNKLMSLLYDYLFGDCASFDGLYTAYTRRDLREGILNFENYIAKRFSNYDGNKLLYGVDQVYIVAQVSENRNNILTPNFIEIVDRGQLFVDRYGKPYEKNDVIMKGFVHYASVGLIEIYKALVNRQYNGERYLAYLDDSLNKIDDELFISGFAGAMTNIVKEKQAQFFAPVVAYSAVQQPYDLIRRGLERTFSQLGKGGVKTVYKLIKKDSKASMDKKSLGYLENCIKCFKNLS